MTARPTIVQINLSPTLGGAEVYTAFMSRALAQRGWPTRVLVDAKAKFWRDLEFGGVELVRVADVAAAAAAVTRGDPVLIHGSLPARLLSTLKMRTSIIGVAHQAIYEDSWPAYFDSADVMFGVSQYVIDTLRAHGVASVYEKPLYGVGEIDRRHTQATPQRGPLCEWDEHKVRDLMLAAGERIRGIFEGATPYVRREGITLGIVSRLAPLKQFPALFEILAPVIAAQHGVNVEVFGVAVGYKALREMRIALRPLAGRVRLWGHQRDVAPVYHGIDYLLTGLPEREALGLNVIESGLCDTPVLAVAAPPFTETVRDGVTGFLYTDPRRDRGAHFARLLANIVDGTLKPDMAQAAAHLELFSFASFAGRVDAAMQEALARVRPSDAMDVDAAVVATVAAPHKGYNAARRRSLVPRTPGRQWPQASQCSRVRSANPSR